MKSKNKPIIYPSGKGSRKMRTTPPNQKPNILTILFSIVATVFVCSSYLVWTYLIRPMMKTHREEATKLNAILSSIADGVIVQDLTGKIEIMNPSAQKIIDNTIDSMLATQEFDEKTRQARLSSLMSFLTNLQFYETEDIEVGQCVLSAHAAPIICAEEKIGSVVVLRDVTAEAEAKRLKDDFITTISHELRTPLSVIRSYNDLHRMSINQIVGAYQANFLRNLENVDEQIDSLLHLIEQMLDLTQISAGALGIDEEEVNLLEIVETEANHWQDSMTNRELIFQLDLPLQAIWVEGDENRLGRVMHNLLKNAYHYTLPGGKVELSVQSMRDRVQINVRDTGVGIVERDKPLIFSRFYRAIHAEDTFEVGGAGLGLFLSKAIVEAHGGRIWFESQVNKGSTFSFTLPTIKPSSNHQS